MPGAVSCVFVVLAALVFGVACFDGDFCRLRLLFRLTDCRCVKVFSVGFCCGGRFRFNHIYWENLDWSLVYRLKLLGEMADDESKRVRSSYFSSFLESLLTTLGVI